MTRKLTNANSSDNSRKTKKFHWILVYDLSLVYVEREPTWPAAKHLFQISNSA